MKYSTTLVYFIFFDQIIKVSNNQTFGFKNNYKIKSTPLEHYSIDIYHQ